MYIGPWQEFKLARILQLKDKVEREDDEDNQLPAMGGAQKDKKAYSVSTRFQHGRSFEPAQGFQNSHYSQQISLQQNNFNNGDRAVSNYSHGLRNEGTPFGTRLHSNNARTTNATSKNNQDNAFTKSQSRATSKHRRHLEQSIEEAQHKYKVEEQFQIPRKAVPKLVAHDKKPAGDKLYQGVVRPGRRMDNAAVAESLARIKKVRPTEGKPPIGRTPGRTAERGSKSKDPRSIFSVPQSLGGKPQSRHSDTLKNPGTAVLAQRALSKQRLRNVGSTHNAPIATGRAQYHQVLSEYQHGQTQNQMPSELQNNPVKVVFAGNRYSKSPNRTGGSQYSDAGANGVGLAFDQETPTPGSRLGPRALAEVSRSISSHVHAQANSTNQYSEAGSSKLQPSDNFSYKQHRRGDTKGYQAMNLKRQMQFDQATGEPIFHPPEKIHPNKAIDKSYEQWNRFENFLQFAQKKEVRDRLKEFDAPSLTNYIDPDTMDKIAAARKPQAMAGKMRKAKANEQPSKKEVQEEHRQRIQKMKELYGMFMKMEKEENGQGQERNEEEEKQPEDGQQFSSAQQPGMAAAGHLLPEVPLSPSSHLNGQHSPQVSHGGASNHLENIRLPDIPQDQLGKSLQSQNNAVRQNVAPTSQNFMKTNKFSNVRQAPYADATGEQIEVDIQERAYASIKKPAARDRIEANKTTTLSPFKMSQKKQSLGDSSKLDSRLDRKEQSGADGVSLLDNDVDGLLNWAKELPDVTGPDGNGFEASGSSFFRKGLV